MKENLWQQVVEPYLAWRDHRFTARTVAGRIAGKTNDILQQYLYYFGVWEPQATAFILRRLQPGDGFIDVGANIGYFSLLAARRVGAEGCVTSIEASPDIFHFLTENIARNRSAIRALNFAASDTRGTVTLYQGDEHNCGTTTIAATAGASVAATISSASLDELLTDQEKIKARLIKIDVEGAEASVVAGMKSLLTTGRKDCEFLVEIHPEMLARLGRKPDDVLLPFCQAGFHPYVMENDYDSISYLWPNKPRGLRPLREAIDYDMNVVFSKIETDEL